MTQVEFFQFLATHAQGDLERRLQEFVQGRPITEKEKLETMKRLFLISLFGPAWPSLN